MRVLLAGCSASQDSRLDAVRKVSHIIWKETDWGLMYWRAFSFFLEGVEKQGHLLMLARAQTYIDGTKTSITSFETVWVYGIAFRGAWPPGTSLTVFADLECDPALCVLPHLLNERQFSRYKHIGTYVIRDRKPERRYLRRPLTYFLKHGDSEDAQIIRLMECLYLRQAVERLQTSDIPLLPSDISMALTKHVVWDFTANQKVKL
ncbi:hypothetical protein A4X13_0g7464 [Tilletia indica]|uniref:Uncharacterized protein n=1 Tax=Tilletia indica TaxID=43049 RepID=A0A8T8SJ37_9BASI|nr:hypothetical protein A4X13_0g7464 [Tilletia indica]